jgi:hypothetical protein
MGVRNPMAMSLVRLCPPSAMTAVCTMDPFWKMAMSVVPPPMSTRHTPSSFSSSVSTASLEASGCSTMSATLRPPRLAHLTMFCALVTAPVTMCTRASSRAPVMPRGSLMPDCSSTMNSCGST